MVREAEEYADEDKKVKERIDARNGLASDLETAASVTCHFTPHLAAAHRRGRLDWWGRDPTRADSRRRYNMKNTLDDDEKGVADKLSADDKEEIENTINEALDWLDENPEADKDEYVEAGGRGDRESHHAKRVPGRGRPGRRRGGGGLRPETTDAVMRDR